MKKQELISKLHSIRLYLIAHPDNVEGSECADRISNIEEIIEEVEKKIK